MLGADEEDIFLNWLLSSVADLSAHMGVKNGLPLCNNPRRVYRHTRMSKSTCGITIGSKPKLIGPKPIH